MSGERRPPSFEERIKELIRNFRNADPDAYDAPVEALKAEGMRYARRFSKGLSSEGLHDIVVDAWSECQTRFEKGRLDYAARAYRKALEKNRKRAKRNLLLRRLDDEEAAEHVGATSHDDLESRREHDELVSLMASIADPMFRALEWLDDKNHTLLVEEYDLEHAGTRRRPIPPLRYRKKNTRQQAISRARGKFTSALTKMLKIENRLRSSRELEFAIDLAEGGKLKDLLGSFKTMTDLAPDARRHDTGPGRPSEYEKEG